MPEIVSETTVVTRGGSSLKRRPYKMQVVQFGPDSFQLVLNDNVAAYLQRDGLEALGCVISQALDGGEAATPEKSNNGKKGKGSAKNEDNNREQIPQDDSAADGSDDPAQSTEEGVSEEDAAEADEDEEDGEDPEADGDKPAKGKGGKKKSG